MVHSLAPEHLAIGNGLDGLNQVGGYIVSWPDTLTRFRYLPHAQQIIWCGPRG